MPRSSIEPRPRPAFAQFHEPLMWRITIERINRHPLIREKGVSPRIEELPWGMGRRKLWPHATIGLGWEWEAVLRGAKGSTRDREAPSARSLQEYLRNVGVRHPRINHFHRRQVSRRCALDYRLPQGSWKSRSEWSGLPVVHWRSSQAVDLGWAPGFRA